MKIVTLTTNELHTVVGGYRECICKPGQYKQDLGCWPCSCEQCAEACLADGVGMQSCNPCSGSPGMAHLHKTTNVTSWI